MIYNQTAKIFQYCAGTSWIRATPDAGTGSGGCANPAGTEGEIIYNQDYNIMQGCAGTTWLPMGPEASRWIYIDVSKGYGRHACGIKIDGSLWCWGNSSSGALGTGSVTSFTANQPLRVNDGGSKWKSVSAGGDFTCGIKSDDTLWCWGADFYGTLGNGVTTTDPQGTPVQVGSETWKKISAGYYHVCGIKSDDSLWCWGRDDVGQLGNGSGVTGDQASPTVVTGGATWKYIDAGQSFTCGIRSNDTLWCWGTDGNGQLGNGGTTGNQVDPSAVTGGATWTQVSLGSSSACALRTDNSAWCWGWNYQGQLGNGNTTQQTSPAAVSGGGTWNYITTNYTHGCGIKTDGSLWCWGGDYWGTVGDGPDDAGDELTPVAVDSSDTWVMVDSQWTSNCAINQRGHIACWGAENTTSEEDMEYRLLPTPVVGDYKWTKITAGGHDWYYYEHSCGLRTDGVVMCWGFNGEGTWDDYGALGNNMAQKNSAVPVTVSGGHLWKDIDAGDNYTCGIRTDDVAMCWGHNTSGQVGDGSLLERWVPVTVSGGHTWSQISAGDSHTCGVRTDGAAMCWGGNFSGALGNGSTTDSSTPVAVSGGYSWKMVSAGRFHSCGIRTDNVAMCWGSGGHGRLGNGGTSDSSIPVTVSGNYTWSWISAGSGISCGVRTDGVAMCWGYDWDWYDQLVPVVMPGGGVWTMYEAANTSNEWSCGIKIDGSGWCGGYNYEANFGDGTFNDNLTGHTEIAGNSEWKWIALGDPHTCGVTKNGTALCWGWRGEGVLGDGYLPENSSPEPMNVCSNPLADGGDMFYNNNLDVMQYCNGTEWISIGKAL